MNAQQPLHIVLIGAGNVAHHLAASFAGHPFIRLVQLFNHRRTKQASALAAKYHAPLTTQYQKLLKDADVYLIAVKDDALPGVAESLSELRLNGLVLHTSGSVDMQVLKKASKHTGVYYPLQTFSKANAVDWKQTPVLVEGSSPAALSTLKRMAASVSGSVRAVDSAERLKMHLAAVLACNFTNALYAAAFGYVQQNLGAKDTELLKPIMQQAFANMLKTGPKKAQTGPAKRNDKTVMARHLALLASDPQLSRVYRLLSALIMTQQSTNSSGGKF